MLNLVWSVGGFLVAIGILVAFHEFGHYWVARRCGVKVLRFSLGFGKPLWTRTSKDGVEWVVSALPLGGYVKMLDEREGEVPANERHLAFNTQSLGKRALIVAAGPIFNFALAILFYWAVFILGVEGIKPLLAEPPAASIAAKVGLHQGDQVLRIGDVEIATWNKLRTELLSRALEGKPVPVVIKTSGGETRELVIDLAAVRVDPEFLFNDLGFEVFQPEIPALIESVVKGDPADDAGLKTGDLFLSFNGTPVTSWQQWSKWVRAHPGEVAKVQVKRGNETLERNLIIGHGDQGLGKIGARVAVPPELWQDLRAEDRLNPIAAVPAAIRYTGQMSMLTLKMLWRMVLGDVSIKNVSGPIQIAEVAGITAQVGFVPFLAFMAIVSVSLGVLNLLPVPLLDGGHLLYYAVEAVKGSPVSERMMEMGQRLGVTFLVALMGLAFYNDIARLLN
ncbi:RIP metalloprotease RseP [Stenotrophobium rhamnosiphilum]|uniref:Zinc metalloprotease n=1 Tax=Stenotrophobium rhamnosiphilum TaxID=2029166 RepID=A0A2T5MHX4_9GAMM|nr:RIP metalloprotease RseP [Stenotrophobium rhamnosiphilum]PTU32164.1 RIP metalloprotease RseP [Stenotrophobium rhamnosiphilum]